MRSRGARGCGWALLLGVLWLSGGCNGGSSSSSDEVKLGVYGNLPAATRALMEEAGIRIVPLDGNLYEVDGSGRSTGRYPENLVVVGGGGGANASGVGARDLETSPLQEALEAIYNKQDDPQKTDGHVLLLYPTDDLMDSLSEQLGESFDIDQAGEAQLLFYGRTQANGIISVVGHIDASTVPTVISRDGGTSGDRGVLTDLARFASPDQREDRGDYVILRNWILETRGRPRGERTASGGARSDTSKNLLEIAQTYVASLTSDLWGKSFRINNYVVAVHNFDGTDPNGGKDWYYLHQENIHDGSGGGYTFERESQYWYSRIDGDHYWVGGGDVCDCYLENLYVENRLVNGDEGVVLADPKPEAINQETVHTTSTSHSFGASVSGGYSEADGVEVLAGLSYGYNCTDSKQFTTRDVNVVLETNQKVAWRYTYKRPERSSPWYNLTRPADLAISTYTPHQMWIWAINTASRNRQGSFQITFKPVRAGVYTRNSGSLEPRHITQEGSLGLSVQLPRPPLLAFEVRELTFDRDGKETNESKSFANYDVQGRVSLTASDSWFAASLVSANNKKQVAITGVQKNTTGSARQGTVVLQREGGGESIKLTIHQLP